MAQSMLRQICAGFLFIVATASSVPGFAWNCNFAGSCYQIGELDVSAEFIYWQVNHSDDLLIAVSDSSRNVVAPRIANGRIETYHFQYEPGFRVNVGYALPCTDWKLGASYTYFHQRSHQTTTAPLGGGLWASTFPTTPGLIFGLADEAQTFLKLQYDLIDITLSKTFCCDHLLSRPYFGVRSLIFDEQMNVNYTFDEGVTPGALIKPGSANWSVYLPTVGVTAGYEGVYNICRGWGIRGKFGGSFLGARVNHHQHWTLNNAGAIVDSSNLTHHGQCIWGWDLALGLNTYTSFGGCPFNFGIGYEIYDWWNMPRQRYYPSPVYPGVATSDETGRFTVHGLYVRLGSSF